MQERSRQRRLGCERLEARQLLTGDVTASVQSGKLFIQGDNAANWIGIWQDSGMTGSFYLAGQNAYNDISGNDQRTTINGDLGILLLTGVTNGIDIDLGSGSDKLQITQADIPGPLDVVINDGSFFTGDSIGFFSDSNLPTINSAIVDVQGPMTVQAHGGFQQLQHLRVAGDLNLSLESMAGMAFGQTGSGILPENSISGNTSIALDGAYVGFRHTRFLGDVSIQGSGQESPEGGNTVEFVACTMLGDLTATGGDASDTILLGPEYDSVVGGYLGTIAGDVTISTGNARDYVSIGTSILQSLQVDLGPGNEGGPGQYGVALGDLAVQNDVLLQTGDGFDNVFVDGLSADDVTVDTGAASDGIILKRINATNLTVISGDDNDPFDSGDVVGMYNVNASATQVYTGRGDEGNGFFGVVLASVSSTLLRVDTGDGFDNVLLADIISASLQIDTGDMSDGVVARNISGGTASFLTGGGGDCLGIYDCAVAVIHADLGAGNDLLWLSHNTASLIAEIDGEAGANLLFIPVANSFAAFTKRNFSPVASILASSA